MLLRNFILFNDPVTRKNKVSIWRFIAAQTNFTTLTLTLFQMATILFGFLPKIHSRAKPSKRQSGARMPSVLGHTGNTRTKSHWD